MPAIRRSISVCICSFLLPISAALAGTSPWEGPYIGAYIGDGYGNNHLSTNAGSVTSTSYFSNSADINSVNAAGTSAKNHNTGIIGIQAGHDWLWKDMLYGVAFDFGALPMRSSKGVTITYPSNTNNYTVSTSMSSNWLFTLRGRLGYQTMIHWPSLFYVTGGMALTQLKVTNSFTDNSSLAGLGGNSASQNQIGWTAGVGVELLSFQHASLNFEYLYIYVPSVKTSSTIYNSQGGFGVDAQSLNNSFSTTGKLHANLLKMALNYRIDE
jgi:outer membrane immunogenic protein